MCVCVCVCSCGEISLLSADNIFPPSKELTLEEETKKGGRTIFAASETLEERCTSQVLEAKLLKRMNLVH